LQSPLGPSSTPFLRLGTRGSPLARAQAETVRALVARHNGVPENLIEIVVIRTDGDRTQAENLSLSEIGGKGLFSKEIEAALRAGEIDVGVHSTKDMATVLPHGLEMPVFLEREDVRDAFISLVADGIEGLPQGARLGSSSLRRRAQLRHIRPDLEVVEFRGNVATRLEKLKAGVADATLLAMAGLNRLGNAELATAVLDPLDFPPAPGQGAIGLEIRAEDDRAREAIAPLDHGPAHDAVAAERAMLRVLDGSCRTPIGVFTRRTGTMLSMRGQVLSPDGAEGYIADIEGPAAEAVQLGTELGQDLLGQAGDEFIAALKMA